jgi:hypothetical protein
MSRSIFFKDNPSCNMSKETKAAGIVAAVATHRTAEI